MEKKGNIDGFNPPPPPYGNPQHKVAPAGAPSGDEYDPNSQQGPLSRTQNPEGPGHPVVVPQGPPQAVVFVQPSAMANPPDDYLGCSVCVTICCSGTIFCWWIGALAIIRSKQCRAAIAAGDRATAVVKSLQALNLIKAALGLLFGSLIIVIVLCGIFYGAR